MNNINITELIITILVIILALMFYYNLFIKPIIDKLEKIDEKLDKILSQKNQPKE